jgi:RimJ/RimL family protein N-acetyltransferase
MWDWMPVLSAGTSFEAYFDNAVAEAKTRQLFPFIITRVSDGAFAGLTAFLDANRTHRRVRIGYNWHPEKMRGTNIFLATQLAMIKRALECRVRRIEWKIDQRNERAIAAFEKLGVMREGTLRHYLRLADGSWADQVIFSLLSEESADVIKQMEAQLGFE